jgi:hypothetical protein
MVESTYKSFQRRAFFIRNEIYDGKASKKYRNLPPYKEKQDVLDLFKNKLDFETLDMIDEPACRV